MLSIQPETEVRGISLQTSDDRGRGAYVHHRYSFLDIAHAHYRLVRAARFVFL